MFRLSKRTLRGINGYWNHNLLLKTLSSSAHHTHGELKDGSFVTDDVKPYDDIPLVKGLPLIGTLTEWMNSRETYHELIRTRVQRYGPIFRETMGLPNISDETVFTANVNDWETVLRAVESDTDTMHGGRPWSTSAYTNSRGTLPLISDMEGTAYKRIKESLMSLLIPKEIAKNVPLLSDIVDDFTTLLESRMNEDGVVGSIRKLVHMWTVESGGSIVFRARLGALDPDNEKAKELVEASTTYFDLLAELEFGSPHHKLLMSTLWRNYANSIDTCYDITKDYCKKYGEHVTDKSSDLTDEEREWTAMTVLVSATDTTSNTALWTLTELSTNQEVQEKIHAELTKHYTGGQLTNKNIQLPYLRGFLKEVFRVRPLIAMLNRILSTDLVLSGYHVPAGTNVNMLMGAYNEEELFTDSHVVKPERWDRRTKSSNANSFAILPFGFGYRSCLGRRLAEVELYILIAKMVYKYKIHPVKEYDSTMKGFFVSPRGAIDIRLEKRV